MNLNVDGAIKTMQSAAAANGTAVSKNVTRAMFHSLLDEISGTLAGGNKVMFAGFGTFSVTKKSERKGKTPDGVPFHTKEQLVPKFKAHKNLKEKVKA